MKKETIEILIMIAAVIVLVLIIKKSLRNAGEALNILDTEEEDKKEKEYEKNQTELELSAFSPLFFQTEKAKNAKASIFTQATANRLTSQLKNSVGTFNDDEQMFVSVFKNCKTKSQVSFLAYVFKNKYSKDMFQFINDYFNDEWGTTANKEYKTVLNYVAKLPNYVAK